MTGGAAGRKTQDREQPDSGARLMGHSARRAHFVVVAAFIAIAICLHMPGLIDGPTLDGALFTEFAVGMRSGLLLYRDLWDDKPPGVFVAFAIAQAATPWASPWFGPWLLTALSSALIASLTYLLLLPVSWRAAFVGGAVVAGYVSVYPIALGGGQTEPLATASALASLAIAVRAPNSLVRAGLCGVLLGIALVTSFIMLPVVLALVIILAQKRVRVVKRLAMFFVGGIAVAAFSVVVLAAFGVLADAWSAIVVYNASYVILNRALADRLSVMVAASALFLAPLLLPSGVGLARWFSARTATRIAVAAAAWVGGEGLLIVLSGRLEPHYLITIVPALALLAIPSVRVMLRPGKLRFAGVALLAAAFLVAIPALIAFAARGANFADQPKVHEVAEWLRERSSHAGKLFIWGDEPELYYAAGFLPATPYLHVLALVTPGYGGQELSERVALELATDPPEFIVDAGSASPGAPGIEPLLVLRPVVADWTLHTIDPIRDFVRQHYNRPIEVAGWLIYERVGAGGSP